MRHNAAKCGERTAIVFDGQQISWEILSNRAVRVASGLVAEGIDSQERVAILDRNGPEQLEWQFGCAMANVVNVGLNWRLAPTEMEFTINDAGARVLLVGADFFDAVEAIEPRLETVARILAIGDHPRWDPYDDWVGRHEAVDPRVTSRPDDVAAQFYTSGTTGRPKGVMLTNSNLLALLERVAPRFGMRAGIVNLVTLPMFHSGGMLWALAGMHQGCTTVVARQFAPDSTLDLLIEHSVTLALFVPAMLAAMCSVRGARDRSYPIERIVYGGSPISDETLLDAIATFRCDFVQNYGMTETTGSIVLLEPADHDPLGPRAHLLRSAGRPFPWVECRIVDPETGSGCATGVVGELWTRSAQNMKGYWRNPDATAATITADGWLRTGDAGYVDEDGYVFLTDRVKDMIVSGGENIYPAEVENVLAGHAGISEVAVIGVPSERWGETVMAVVVTNPGTDLTEAEIITYAKDRLARYKCPTFVDFVAELPRNPSGKVLKRELREPYWVGHTRRVG